MIFVPLPLVTTLILLGGLGLLLRTRDMARQTNQLFAGVVGLYALQSLLLSLRWGYDWQIGLWIALLAPVLPVMAYLAYLTLNQRLTVSLLWPLGVIALNWVVLIGAPDLADLIILLTFLGFGAAILRQSTRGEGTGLVRIGQASGALWAMQITGAALICAALMDVYVLVDFLRTGGENIGWVISLVQPAFLLIIGLAGFLGQTSGQEDGPDPAPIPETTQEDAAIIARLHQLFAQEGLHRDTELNLRRLSRRLGLPDRRVSQAINRHQGMSLSHFVNQVRIEEACALLAQTDQTVLQVSLAAGFLTKSNFNREFLRVTGRTPSQWRAAPEQVVSKAERAQ